MYHSNYKINKMKKYFLLILTISLTLFTSCSEELNITSPNVIKLAKFITDGPTAKTAVTNAYDDMQSTFVGGAYPKMFSGLYADDFDHTGSFPTFTQFWTNGILTNNVNLRDFWRNHYDIINTTTEVIKITNGLSSESISTTDRSDVLAEAHAMRAWAYFQLVQNFGGLPITERTVPLDGLDANNEPRKSQAQVITYIMNEISLAEGKIPNNGNTRFSNNALQVLKAHVQMFNGDYPGAESTLQPLIGQYSLTSNYASLFTNGNDTSETIFRLAYSTADSNSLAFFFYPAPAGRREVAPSQNLVNSFPAGDVRKNLIANNTSISSAFLNKYQDTGNGTDSPYVYRYADVLLMYAEVLARRDDANASTYINLVRTRAGLANVTLTSANVVDMIANERRWELYGEGDRWNTVKRLGLAQDVITNNKSVGSWNANKALWPIPQSEIDGNKAMTQNDQNPGY